MISLVAESLFWVAVASCTVAQTAIVRGVVAGCGPARPGMETTAESPPLTTGSAVRPVREAMWALLPGVVLALVLVWTWRTMHQSPPTSSPDTVPAIIAPSTGT
jgi:hypothetical protein